MATSVDFANYVKENLDMISPIEIKKMFGGYAVYYKNNVVALLCDNQFFLKPTKKAREMIDNIVMQPPYPKAKNYFLIENIEDKHFTAEVILTTYKELFM